MVQSDYFERNIRQLAQMIAKIIKLKYADIDIVEFKKLTTIKK